MRSCGGDLGRFDALKDMRGLEYELDRVANRAARDKQVGPGARGGRAKGRSFFSVGAARGSNLD